MKKKYSLSVLCILLITFLLSESCNNQNHKSTKKKPNIIVILADDLGYAGLSCFGGKGISSPNLDKLAQNGIKCTNFYSNSTVCSPTRVALMSGRYQQRVGLDHIYFHCLDTMGFNPKTNPSLPVIMKEAGYKTAIFGKWHLGSGLDFQPKAHGFDDFTGFLDGNIDFISKHNTESEVDWFVHHEPKYQEGYVTHILNDAVVDFINQEYENPFFIYLSEAAVHLPMQSPNDPPMRTDSFYNYRVDTKFPKEEYMRRYSEMVTAMDEGIGKIMQTLRKHNIEDNTLVIFTSDNGGERIGVQHGKVNGNKRGHKGTLYEGGINVPTIFYWKDKFEEGIVNKEVMMTMDILPTILDITGIEYKGLYKFDGKSLYSTLLENKPIKRDLFWMHKERLVMRRGNIKLIRQNRGVELYDLASDPFEQNNLAKNPGFKSMLNELIEASDKWHHETATGFPAGREIGVKVKKNWPCKRDLKTFNKGKEYKWVNGKAVIE